MTKPEPRSAVDKDADRAFDQSARLRVRRWFFLHQQTVLLGAIVAAFLARPLAGEAGIGPLLFGAALMAIPLVALYTMRVDDPAGETEALPAAKRRRFFVALTLGLPAIAGRVAAIFAPSRGLPVADSICWLLLLAFITGSQLQSVLRRKEVTSDTISMSVSIYLLLGLTWTFIYFAMYELQPNAFLFPQSRAQPTEQPLEPQSVFPVLMYFSLSTLTTIGFGDITPVTLQARFVAVFEAVTGQFYLAVLVARLVGMHLSRSLKSETGG